MNILIDARPLQEKFGGVKEYLENILFYLSQEEVKKHNYLLFFNSFQKNFSLPSWLSGQKNLKICFFRWPNQIINASLKFWNWPNIFQIIEKEEKIKIDLIFLPNLNFIPFQKKTKYFLTIHDLSFAQFPFFYSFKQRIWHYLVNYQKLIQEAQKIITVSEYTKNHLLSYLKVPKEKVEVVYPVIKNFSLDQKTTKTYLEKYKLTTPYIFYLGSLEPRKNFLATLQAFSLAKKFLPSQTKLVLAGPLHQKNKISQSDVVYLGQVSHEEKISLLSQAKIFLFPSLFEGFGFPPLEAQSLGVPVIASNTTSLPEILGESALYVNPWNVSEIKEAILALWYNENLRETFITLGRKNCQKFKTDENIKKLIQLFEIYENRN